MKSKLVQCRKGHLYEVQEHLNHYEIPVYGVATPGWGSSMKEKGRIRLAPETCLDCLEGWMNDEFRPSDADPEVLAAYRLGGLEAAERVHRAAWADRILESSVGGRPMTDSEKKHYRALLKKLRGT